MAYEDSFAYKLLQKFESMRERVKNYISVVDLCPFPVFITTREGNTILYVNGAYKNLIGKGEEFLQNCEWLSVVHPDDRDGAILAWKVFTSNPVDGVTMVHTHRYLSATGVVIPATTYTTAVANNGLVGYIIPTDCLGLLFLGIDLKCPVQQHKMDMVKNGESSVLTVHGHKESTT